MREELYNKKNMIDLSDDSDIEVDNLDLTLGDIGGEDTTELKEWDLSDDEDIQEFLSHDYDVISESRRRLQEKKARGSKSKIAKSRKEDKKKEEKPKKEKVKKDKPQKDKSQKGKDEMKSVDFIGVIKNLMAKWLEIYHAHTMKILYGALGVLVLLLAVAIIVTLPDNKKDDDKNESTPATSERQSEEESTDEEEVQVTVEMEAEDSEIRQLIVAYIDAVYISEDMEALKLVFDNVEGFDIKNENPFIQKYVEVFENIQCYKVKTTTVENGYVVYVTYDAKFENIEARLPIWDIRVVKYNEAAGKYMVHGMTDDESAQIELELMLSTDPYIAYMNSMQKEYETRLEQAITSDENLKKVYELLIKVGTTVPEENSSAEDTSSGEATSEETDTTAAQ